jgi:hypothetical protein
MGNAILKQVGRRNPCPPVLRKIGLSPVLRPHSTRIALLRLLRGQNNFWISAVTMEPNAVISAAQTGAEILIRRMAWLPPASNGLISLVYWDYIPTFKVQSSRLSTRRKIFRTPQNTILIGEFPVTAPPRATANPQLPAPRHNGEFEQPVQVRCPLPREGGVNRIHQNEYPKMAAFGHKPFPRAAETAKPVPALSTPAAGCRARRR